MTDAELMLFTPTGYRFELVFAAYLKHALVRELNPRHRLDLLEMLDYLGQPPMPIEAIKSLEPMPSLGVEIVETALQADRDRDGLKRCSTTFDIVTRADVFKKICLINPSILTALRTYNHRPERCAA